MDTKTLNLNFGDGEVEKLREVLRRMGEFIAYFEVAENKMLEWKQDVEETIHAHQQHINDQLQEVNGATDELRNLMTETGVARWRIAAEENLNQGKDHLRSMQAVSDQHVKALEASSEEFKRLAKKSFDRLDRASTYTIKNISEAVGSFKLSEFQKLTDQCRETVEESAVGTLDKFKNLVTWFHWKNIGLAVAITLVTSLTMGLYLNDELPWEIHSQVAMQRDAGKALISAWPQLSKTERQRIVRNSNSSAVV